MTDLSSSLRAVPRPHRYGPSTTQACVCRLRATARRDFSVSDFPQYTVFHFVWAVVLILGVLFFHFSRNAELKRRVLPVFTVGIGILFFGFIYVG